MPLYLPFNLSLYGNSFEYRNNPIIKTLTNNLRINIILQITTVISFGGGGNTTVSPVPWLLFPCSIVSDTHLKNCFIVWLSALSRCTTRSPRLWLRLRERSQRMYSHVSLSLSEKVDVGSDRWSGTAPLPIMPQL